MEAREAVSPPAGGRRWWLEPGTGSGEISLAIYICWYFPLIKISEPISLQMSTVRDQ